MIDIRSPAPDRDRVQRYPLGAQLRQQLADRDLPHRPLVPGPGVSAEGTDPEETAPPRSRRSLGLEGQDLSRDQWVDLLSREPGLWRRPIAVKGERIVVGFDADALEELAREGDG